LAILENSGASGFLSQELIASEGNVLRAVILGDEIVTYWKRPQNPDQIITTIAKEARIDKQWKPDLQEMGKLEAREFAKNTGINLAAIDFVFPLGDPEPQPLFLEINYYFGRRGLGGTLKYYSLLYKALQNWLIKQGFDPESVSLV
jgi:ribosomal protein S6--L-glutamate ligase